MHTVGRESTKTSKKFNRTASAALLALCAFALLLAAFVQAAAL